MDTLLFSVGSGGSVDLSLTLPTGVVRGGTFSIASSGSPLPTGMSLTAAGILSVGTATAGSVSGVVFSYSEP